MLVLGESNRMLPPEWQIVLGVIAERVHDFLPTDEQLKWAAWSRRSRLSSPSGMEMLSCGYVRGVPSSPKEFATRLRNRAPEAEG